MCDLPNCLHISYLSILTSRWVYVNWFRGNIVWVSIYWVGSFVTFLCLNYQLAFDLPLSYLPIHLLGWEGEKGKTEEGERQGCRGQGAYSSKVIEIAVMAFISTDHGHNILHGCILGKLPVVDGDGRCGTIGESSFFDLVQKVRVRLHSLFFQVPTESVRQLRRQQVQDEVAIEEGSLHCKYQQPLESRRLYHLHQHPQRSRFNPRKLQLR